MLAKSNKMRVDNKLVVGRWRGAWIEAYASLLCLGGGGGGVCWVYSGVFSGQTQLHHVHILATNLAADSIRGHIKCSLTDTVSFSFSYSFLVGLLSLHSFFLTLSAHTHIHTHTKLTNHLHANATLARTRPIGLCDEIRHATAS